MMNNMMEYKGYHAIMEYDSDDNLLVGEVYGIEDVLNFHGRSIDEFREHFERCIDEYLEWCERIGQQPCKEYKGSFNIRISPELHRQASLTAFSQKISLNQFVATAIKHELRL